MKRNVLLLSQSFEKIKDTNLQLAASTSRDLLEDPFRPIEHSVARWKIQSAYGDIGLKYQEDETVAYVASRMPAVYSACHRVLREVSKSSSLQNLVFVLSILCHSLLLLGVLLTMIFLF